MSRFWDWALAAYARPGAAEACLELQDGHGQNVPLLLWTVWAVRQGRAPDLARGAALARAYETAAGARLREARRALKAPLTDLAPARQAALRSRVKSLELEGEKLLMEGLERLTGPGGGDPAQSLAEASLAWGAPLPAQAFAPLLQRL